MRTRDDLWDWVWEEGWADPELEADFEAATSEEIEDFDLWDELGPADEGLAAPAGAGPVASTPVSTMSTAPPITVPAAEAITSPPAASPAPAVTLRPVPAPPPRQERVRPSRLRRAHRRRRFRRAALVVLFVVAAAAAAAWWYLPRPPGPQATTPRPAGPVPPASQVVATWTVWDDEDYAAPHVAVLTAGGGEDPLALAVPGNMTVSIPGHGPGTVDDAAATGDVTVVAATIENVLGVQVDESWGIPLSELGALVDELGSIEVEGRLLRGSGVVDYLAEPPADAVVERFIRWQAVLSPLLPALHQEPDVVAEVPAGIRAVLVAGADEVLSVPVEEVGAGLVRPDDAGLARLVAEHLVPTSGEDKVQLVVLNGNGKPGVGQRVARLLVPEGFRLVSSQNAARFGYRETKIIASTREDLPAARKAKRLLEVGIVMLSNEASGLADVTVVVGRDFGGP